MRKLSFSQRRGITPVRETLQVESISNRVRNKVWNTLLDCFWKPIERNSTWTARSGYRETIIVPLWDGYFGLPIDTLPGSTDNFTKFIRDHWMECKYYECFDFLEYCAGLRKDFGPQFSSLINKIFEEELVGYRLVNGEIVDIIQPFEIDAIESAIDLRGSFSHSSIHIASALGLYSNRENPDYRNSIKESISAVESACCVVTSNQKATLGDALRVLESNHQLHGALRDGFSRLYGYTSDADGIRHALTEESNLRSEDAKFMLVACSAFVNYLKEKYASIPSS